MGNFIFIVVVYFLTNMLWHSYCFMDSWS